MAEHNTSDTIEFTGSQPLTSVAPDLVKRNDKETSHIERVLSPDADDAIEKNNIDLSRVDKEVQQYAAAGHIEVDSETSKKLLRKIDRRVLSFMIMTYFLQAIDKGTLAFTSIMHLPEDTGLVGQQVGHTYTYIHIHHLHCLLTDNPSTHGLPLASTSPS
jgi:hypothetical protein